MWRNLIAQFNSVLMAVVIAAIIWAVATSEENPSREVNFPEALPLEVSNLSSDWTVLQKSAESARIRIRAPQASLDELRASAIHLVLNLKNSTPGTQQVSVEAQVADPRIRVITIEPSTVDVRLEPTKSKKIPIDSQVLDAPPEGYAVKTPVSNVTQATVTGAQSLLEQVAEVSADVYLRGSKVPIEREVALAARDLQGNLVKGVSINPSSALVKVVVEPRVGYKDVSIKAVLKGTVAPGYWISNLVVTPSTTTILGSPEVAGKIPGFIETLPIDVTDATTEVSRRVQLALPEGVSLLNNDPVTAKISITPILGGQTVRRRIVLEGLRRGLNAIISPDSVEVILSGPLPSLQNLTSADAPVIIDVSGLEPGVYPLKPKVILNLDLFKVQNIVPDTVQVTLIDPTAPPK